MANKPRDSDDIAKMWKDYLVFTFVRNPYARAASAYTFLNDLIREEKIGELSHQPYCKINFSQFCTNPRILGERKRSFLFFMQSSVCHGLLEWRFASLSAAGCSLVDVGCPTVAHCLLSVAHCLTRLLGMPYFTLLLHPTACFPSRGLCC